MECRLFSSFTVPGCSDRWNFPIDAGIFPRYDRVIADGTRTPLRSALRFMMKKITGVTTST